MELFYSKNIKNAICILNEEESRHCIKVLRHAIGDVINVIDGAGGMYDCKIVEAGKEVVCEVVAKIEKFGGHNYSLVMAVAPTKNIDRYELFLEKATEIGVDCVVPVIGEHSERKIVKPDRLCKILVSAAKQSLKGTIPSLDETESVFSFIKRADNIFLHKNDDITANAPVLKLIAYCGNVQKISLTQAINGYREYLKTITMDKYYPQIIILIGPEGDFSNEEIEFALDNGFKPINLGSSRLRTETAAIAAVSCAYFMLG
ncbi:MAG: RsmE family RNA methyltransferase [Bacteroidales bacterium]